MNNNFCRFYPTTKIKHNQIQRSNDVFVRRVIESKICKPASGLKECVGYFFVHAAF